MAKTSYIIIPPELKDLRNKVLAPGDRFVFPRFKRKTAFISRKRKLDLEGISLFKKLSTFWKTLSEQEKQKWSEAGQVIGLTNWQLFIQDHSARLAADIPGFTDPKTLHQSWVGKVEIDQESDELFIVQIHPESYWIRQKVPGTKSQFSPVKITEKFSLPLEIGISYKSELQTTKENPEACLFADVWYSYQGVDHVERLQIDFDLESNWKRETKSLESTIGHVIGYNLFFLFKNLTGRIYFDNIKASHSGQNWVRDPACRSITDIFPRAFYQVPAHWFVIEKTEGAKYDSVYRDFN